MPARTSDWVRPVPDGPALPLHVRPHTDVDLAAWAGEHRGTVDGWLSAHGAVLFRGFGVDLGGFAAAAQALGGPALPYRERSSPRRELAPSVFTSTDHPPDQPIPLHNENSYQLEFPARLVFCCVRPADHGGQTPLADCRRVLARIDPAIRQRFQRRAVRYVRTYQPGIGLPWQEAFQDSDRARVRQYCTEQDIRAHWDGDGVLRTEQVRPALAVHPGTGQHVWFNHAAFFHASSLDARTGAALLAQLGERRLPTNTYYGDGSPIDDHTMAHIRAAYAAETVSFTWHTGDVLLVDNLLVAHGRTPYQGQRQVIVSMSGLLSHGVTAA